MHSLERRVVPQRHLGQSPGVATPLVANAKARFKRFLPNLKSHPYP